LSSEGFVSLIKRGVPHIYNQHIRPNLPRTTADYNGVLVPAAHWFDSIVPWIGSVHRNNYESALVEGLKNHVKDGDDVVIVGGGWGVTAVVAANQVGDTGSVTVFEGSESASSHVRQTSRLNNVGDRISVNHVIVGEGVNIRGKQGDAENIPPSSIPDCDVLELDCDGAEIDILENIQIRPEVILVESHKCFNCPANKIETMLKELSYNVVAENIADEGEVGFCRKYGINVLEAVQS
jgi:hypothetical protein